jgi:Tfp pilus assembly protein FimT
MRVRHGFTILELLVVMLLGIIMVGVISPSISRSLGTTRLQRVVAVISADLELAQSLAARQRTPVGITVDPQARALRVHDAKNGTVYSERFFDAGSEYPLTSLSASSTSVVVYPNGLASGPLTLTMNAGGAVRVIDMSRVGQVRVSAP